MTEDEKDGLIVRLESQNAAQVVLIEEHIAAQRQAEVDATRYRWLRDMLHGAKCGGGVEVNEPRQVYEEAEPGKEVRIYWYQHTPVGFYAIESSTIDAAIDAAMASANG